MNNLLRHDLTEYALHELCELLTQRAAAISDRFHETDNEAAALQALEAEYLLEEIKRRLMFSAI